MRLDETRGAEQEKKSPPMGSLTIIFRPPRGVTYVASSSYNITNGAKTHPNKLCSSLTDFAFPDKP